MDREIFIVICYMFGICSAQKYSENPCPSGVFPLKNEHCDRDLGFLECPIGSYCQPTSEGNPPVCCPTRCQYGVPLLHEDGSQVQCEERQKRKKIIYWCPRGSICTEVTPTLQLCCPKKSRWMKNLEKLWSR